MTEVIDLDTGEVLHSTALAIPKPGDIVTPGFAEQVRAWIEEQDDFDLVDDHRRRLAAFEHYVRGKEMRSEAQAAARWGEVRVGQLIGQASPNGKYPTDVPGLNALNPEERVWFRRLADHVGQSNRYDPATRLYTGGDTLRCLACVGKEEVA